MNNIFKVSILVIILLTLTACNKQSSAEQIIDRSLNSNTDTKTAAKEVYDKIEVYYFHRTQRCVSCLAIGEKINKTMMEYYSTEIGNNKIDYREINIDSTENKEIAKKFQASASSLYLNAIKGENEKIENVTEVWQLKNDEEKFKSFLKQKIDSLLGK